MQGAGLSDVQLRELEDWVVAPRILQVPGVADVVPFGGLVKQYQVEISPSSLQKFGLTVKQVADALRANNRNAGGALLNSDQQSMVIRGVGRIRGVPDIENIVLAAARGVPVVIRDVGVVRIGAALQTGMFALNDQPGGVEGIALLRRGENPSEVLSALKSALEELNTSGLPRGVLIRAIYDRTELVQNTVHTVSRTLLEGLTIVVFMLMFFLAAPPLERCSKATAASILRFGIRQRPAAMREELDSSWCAPRTVDAFPCPSWQTYESSMEPALSPGATISGRSR